MTMKNIAMAAAMALGACLASPAAAVSVVAQEELYNIDFPSYGYTAVCSGFGSTCAALVGVAGGDYANFTTSIPGVAAAFSDNAPGFAVLGGHSVSVTINKMASQLYYKTNTPDAGSISRITFGDKTFVDLPSVVFSTSGEFSVLISMFPDQMVASIDFWSSQNSWEIAEVGYLPSPNQPGAVPEPASWALMVAGFGMVGFGMRRRTATLARVSA